MRNFWKLSPCLAEPMSSSSRMDPALAKAGPVSNDSNAFVITYLRRKINSYCAEVIASRGEQGENV